MTTLYLAGGENPGHQQILASCGVPAIAVNVTSLLRRKTTSWSLDLPYPDWSWIAYCDGYALESDLEAVLAQVSREPDAVIGPSTWSSHDRFLPMWNGEEEMPDRSNGLVVTDRVFKDRTLLRRALSARIAGNPLGVITGSIDSSINRFDFVISGAWWSSFKFGETQVWDGQKMHRYNADHKAEVRSRHRDHIAALGIDVEQVMRQDADETARLAIVSWMAYGDRLSNAQILPLKSEVTTGLGNDLDFPGSEPGLLDTRPPERRHQTVLPVLGMGTITATERMGDGSEYIEEQVVIRSVGESIRQCDNCFLATSGCPGFTAGATCAYSIPVEIRSKDQLQSVMQAMIEMQTQRVLQARFAEEVSGQELSPEFGKELDRLFNSVEKMRDIMDNRDTLKVTMEARGRSGVLSRLFGSQVGTNARMLGSPVDSDEVLEAVLDD